MGSAISSLAKAAQEAAMPIRGLVDLDSGTTSIEFHGPCPQRCKFLPAFWTFLVELIIIFGGSFVDSVLADSLRSQHFTGAAGATRSKDILLSDALLKLWGFQDLWL